MTKKIVVTGATGQDGSYMIEYLLANTDDTIIAAIRRTSQAILSNLTGVLSNPRVKLVTMDLTDSHSIENLIREEKPDYFINFGAQSYVADSWASPALHMQVNAISLIHILEAVRKHVPACRVYSAGSSEQFGDVKYSPQDEKHPMSPRSMYGVSKCTASHICKIYRESYGIYAVHAILFNHESERRQEYFLTRKVTKGVARIAKAIKEGRLFEPIELGNLDAKRDWSHAEDFVDGIWRMLNQDTYGIWPEYAVPDDPVLAAQMASRHVKEYVLSSGETHSVREFVEKALDAAGLGHVKLEWEKGVRPEDEQYVYRHYTQHDDETWSSEVTDVLVRVNPAFYRPADVEILHGDSTAARRDLGWAPKVSFDELVKRMVWTDMAALGL